MITLDRNAPDWAQVLVTQINQAIDESWTRALPLYTTTTLPSATDKTWLWRPIAVSDGAANKFVAISNGTAWYYLQGTAV